MANSRSHNAKRNFAAGFFNKILNIMLPFIVRTVIIKKMGADYLGLNSLFTSILSVLNVAELGFSSAVVFSLYKPIAENNESEICALLSYYRNVYRMVGTVVLCGGLLVMPFLTFLIEGDYPTDINLYILYLIFLLNSSVSYFAFSYKNVILIASQRHDILSNIDTILKILRYCVQLMTLICWQNYYLYVAWNLIFTVINNLYVHYATKKYYPNYYCNGKITGEKKTDINERVKGLAIGNVSKVARNSFDSVVLSMCCGLIEVTIYSNYYYIMSSIIGFISVLINSMNAGIGNSVATESVEKNYYDFKRFYFMMSWIGGFCTACLFCLYQDFMRLWVGPKLMTSNYVMILFCVYFYITQMGQTRAMYGNAAGLWWNLRKYTVGEMIANLSLNFLLGYVWGLKGILWATIITVTVFSLIGVTGVVYKECFNRSSIDFWRQSVLYIGVTVLACICSSYLCTLVDFGGKIGLLIELIICVFVPNVIFLGLTLLSKMHREYFFSICKNAFKH